MSRLLLAACLFGGLLALPAAAGGSATVLTAVVGPGNETSFVGPDGETVTHLEPGTYTIQADDRSDRRDFTLIGPAVSLHTGFEAVGSHTWTVTLAEGWYRYYDAAFENDFHAQFTVGSPPPVTLQASVGNQAIPFKDAQGAAVRHLDPGTYTVAVHDGSSVNNFRLMGPGVEEHTQVFPLVDYTWTVTLPEGRYSFFSERHTGLHGSFTVGTATTSKEKLLHGVAGPDFSIALVDANWQPVRTLKAGRYTLDVDDRSADHDFHLLGAHVDRSTALAFVGHKKWTLRLARGPYFYHCDPHSIMYGNFKVTGVKKAKRPRPKPKPRR